MMRQVVVVGIILLVWQQWTRPIHASQAAGQETLIGIVGKDFILLGADSSVSQGIALTASNLDKIAPLVEPFPTGRHPSPPLPDLQQQQQQQCIVAAAAGDAATSDRLIGLLQAFATIQEYEAGVGCDVDFVVVDETSQASPSSSPWVKHVEPGVTVKAMAYFARSQLSAIRPGANVCLLIAGMMWDGSESTGSVHRLSFVSHQVQRQLQQQTAKTTNHPQQPQKEESQPTTTMDTTSHDPTNNNNSNNNNDDDDENSTTRPSLTPHLYWLDELGSLQKIHYGAHGLGSNFCLSVLDQGYHPNLSLDQATKLMRDCFQQLRTRYLVNSPQPPCIKCVDATGIRLIR